MKNTEYQERYNARTATIITFAILLLMPFTAGFDFDNVKSYNAVTKEVTVTNAFGLGEELAKIKLDTPIVNYVMPGKDRLVAELTFSSFDNTYTGALNRIDTYNKIGMDIIGRNVKYKYGTLKTRTWTTYEKVCSEGVEINITDGKPVQECISKEVPNSEDYYTWTEFTDVVEIPIGITKVGLFADVQTGDYVEWIPTWFGVEIDEWATWTASFNTNLKAYYNFQTNYTDIYTGAYNMSTNEGTPTYGAPGKFGNGLQITTNNNILMNGTANQFNNANKSYSMWINYSTESGQIISAGGTNYMGFNGGGTYYWKACTAEQSSSAGSATPPQIWRHIAYVRNDTGAKLYINGVLDLQCSGGTPYTTAQKLGTDVTSATDVPDLSVDEFVVWDRALTATEVSDLYNGGAGINISVDTFAPTVTLRLPAHNSQFINAVNINCSASHGTNVTNISLWINGVRNDTEILGIPAGSLYRTLSFADGQYNWTCSAMNKYNVEGWAASNWTFTKDKLAENSQTYNSLTYYGISNTYSVNYTYNNSLYTVTPYFWYNGTRYSATSTTGDGLNNISSRTFTPSAVGSKNLLWQFVLSDGSVYNSSVKTQVVNNIQLGWCNTSLNVSYLNFTYKDEVTSTALTGVISSSTWVYWFGDVSLNRTLSYSNTSNHSSDSFCFEPGHPGINYTLDMQYNGGASYPSRRITSSGSLSNITTNTTLYLLSTSDGLYVTFQVVNQAEQTISGAIINATTSTGTIAQGTTDDAGSVTFWLNPDTSTTIAISKSGYPAYSNTIYPTQSSYTIHLGTSATDTNDTESVVTTTIKPSDEYLNNNTLYSFNVTLSTTAYTFSKYNFTITNQNGTVIASVEDTSSTGGIINSNLNTGTNTTFYLSGFYILNGETKYFTKKYTILISGDTRFSLLNFFTDLRTYVTAGMFGINTFSLNLIIFLIIFIVTGIFSWKFGMYSPIAISGIAFVLTGFFDVVLGMLNIGIATTGINHFPTVFMGILLVAVIIKEAAS